MIKKRDNNCCCVCKKNGVKLVVHHKVRFSSIIQKAKDTFPNQISLQLDFCLKEHNLEIGELLCLECHAQKHIGEKVFSRLSGLKKTEFCKICKSPTYCKGFCSYHYSQFHNKIINEKGERIKNSRLHDNFGKCIVCGKDSVGRAGLRFRFCSFHLSRFKNKMIDLNGKEIRKPKHTQSSIHPCKVCGKNESGGKGFCNTHYNRYKIGQIDINGVEIRPLNFFTQKGDKKVLFLFQNEMLTIKEIANRLGISCRSLYKRIKKWGIIKAFTTP